MNSYSSRGATGGARRADPAAPDVKPDVKPDVNPDVRPDVENASVGDLVGRLMGDLSRLMRAEFALAKAETMQEATRASRGAGLLAGAGVGANLMLTFASLALMFGLGYWIPLGWAALIVAVLWAIVAAALGASGRKAMRTVNPALPQTTDTLKEDAQWAKRPRG